MQISWLLIAQKIQLFAMDAENGTEDGTENDSAMEEITFIVGEGGAG